MWLPTAAPVTWHHDAGGLERSSRSVSVMPVPFCETLDPARGYVRDADAGLEFSSRKKSAISSTEASETHSGMNGSR